MGWKQVLTSDYGKEILLKNTICLKVIINIGLGLKRFFQ